MTHQVQLIEKASKILVLKEGGTLAYGTYETITQQGIDLVSLLKKKEEEEEKDENGLVRFKVRTLSEQCSELTVEEEDEEVNEDKTLTKRKLSSKEEEEEAVAVEEESHKRGAVQGRVYWEYIRAGTGAFLLPFFLVVMVVSQSLYHGSDIFLTYWLVAFAV